MPDDREKLQGYFRSLFPKARHARFHGVANVLPEPLIRRFLNASSCDSFTLLATISDDEGEAVIGEACCALDADTQFLELALSVRDDWQRRGLGTALLKRLEHLAAKAGVAGIFGRTFNTNEGMRRVAQAVGYLSSPVGNGHEIHFEKQLPARTIKEGHTSELRGDPQVEGPLQDDVDTDRITSARVSNTRRSPHWATLNRM